MKRLKILIIILIFLATITVCFAENVVINSKYPAAIISYGRILLNPRAVGNLICDEQSKGTMYYDSDDSTLKYCAGSGTPQWKFIEKNPWSVSGETVYLTDALIDPEVRVGLGTSTPEFALSILTDGGIYAEGIMDEMDASLNDLITSGAGRKFIWYPKKAAFRVGYVDSDQWDNMNIGLNSIALGTNLLVNGTSSIALGQNLTVSSVNAIAIGLDSSNYSVITNDNSFYLKGGNLGIATTAPEFRLSLGIDGGIIASAPVGSGQDLITSGSGYRFLWYPKKASFIAGYSPGDYYDDANINSNSTTIGYGTYNNSSSALAMGYGSSVENSANSVLIGALGTIQVSPQGSFVVGGPGQKASFDNNTLIGLNNETHSEKNLLVGYANVANALGTNIIVGVNNSTIANFNTVIATHSTANSRNTVIGKGLDAQADSSTIIGLNNYNASNSGNSTLLGYNIISSNNSLESVSIGADLTSTEHSSVTIGHQSTNNGGIIVSSFYSGANSNSIAFGEQAMANGSYSIAGSNGITGGIGSISLTPATQASADNAISLTGRMMRSNGQYAISSSGHQTYADGDYSIALGGDRLMSTRAYQPYSMSFCRSCYTQYDDSILMGNFTYPGHLAWQPVLNVGINGSNALTVLKNGNVGFGPSNNANLGTMANRNLRVFGTAGGTNAWQVVSDARLKTNVEPLGATLDKVIKLNGVNFNWKDAETYDEKNHIGVIAQEVLEVFPEVVDTKSQFYSVDYGSMVPIVGKAIVELSDQLDAIGQEIKELDDLLSASL